MTTTDRELLELAAKAAGYEIGFNKNDTPPRPFIVNPTRVDWWNPLEDDEDAQRLSNDLGLMYVVWPQSTMIRCDGMPATKRAITLAAAAIGKEMP